MDEHGDFVDPPGRIPGGRLQISSDKMLEGDAGDYAYFSCFMDGWAKTHIESDFTPDAELSDGTRQLWKQFEETDWLCVRDDSQLSDLRSWVSRVLSRPRNPKPLNQYAINKLCHGIFDGCDFALSTNLRLLIACKCVGGILDDGEYSDPGVRPHV